MVSFFDILLFFRYFYFFSFLSILFAFSSLLLSSSFKSQRKTKQPA